MWLTSRNRQQIQEFMILKCCLPLHCLWQSAQAAVRASKTKRVSPSRAETTWWKIAFTHVRIFDLAHITVLPDLFGNSFSFLHAGLLLRPKTHQMLPSASYVFSSICKLEGKESLIFLNFLLSIWDPVHNFERKKRINIAVT